MIGAVGTVDARNLLALSAVDLTKSPALTAVPGDGAAAVTAGGSVTNVGADLYVPSTAPAVPTPTYNRLGQSSSVSTDGSAALAGSLIDNLRQQAPVSAFTLTQAASTYRLVGAQGSQAP